MITVIDFKPEHLVDMKLITGSIPREVSTHAITFMNLETPIAIFGSFSPSPGVTHIWSLLSEHVKKYPIDFHKTSLKMLEFYMAQYSPQRVQIDVRSDYLMGQQWAESLGFHREGRMRKYGKDKADHYLYARVT